VAEPVKVLKDTSKIIHGENNISNEAAADILLHYTKLQELI